LNAAALFDLDPVLLAFGIWDSTGSKSGLGSRFQRHADEGRGSG